MIFTLFISLFTLFILFLYNPRFNFSSYLYLIFSILLFLLSYIDNISYFDGLLYINNNFNSYYIILLFLFFIYCCKTNNSFKFLILFTNFLGILFLILSNDLILIFLSIELINLSLYLLIGNYTSGIKYFLLSSIISTLILLSLSLIYSTYGNLNIDFLLSFNHYKYNIYGYLLLLISLFFKLGIFPFHQWSPDLYSGISFILMIYIQIFIKYGFLILFYNIHSLFLPLFSYILYFSILTIIILTLLLNAQYNIQRFIAISSIAHIGFLILQYEYSYLYYIYIYNITTLLLLILFNRFSYINKIFITLFFFSLSGLPPLPGFFTKLYILIDLLKLNLISIIIIILLSSIIIASNYINLGLISLKLNNNYIEKNYNILSIIFILFLHYILIF